MTSSCHICPCAACMAIWRSSTSARKDPLRGGWVKLHSIKGLSSDVGTNESWANSSSGNEYCQRPRSVWEESRRNRVEKFEMARENKVRIFPLHIIQRMHFGCVVSRRTSYNPTKTNRLTDSRDTCLYDLRLWSIHSGLDSGHRDTLWWFQCLLYS